MKPWNPLGLRPAIGLLIDQEQVAMSVTATTRKGRREVAHEVVACDDHSREDVLRRMLEPWVPAAGAKRPKAKPWVRVGSPRLAFFKRRCRSRRPTANILPRTSSSRLCRRPTFVPRTGSSS